MPGPRTSFPSYVSYGPEKDKPIFGQRGEQRVVDEVRVDMPHRGGDPERFGERRCPRCGGIMEDSKTVCWDLFIESL